MAGAVDMFMINGAVKKGEWCDVHALPHIIEYTIYSYCEASVGNISIRPVKHVKKCDAD